MRVRKRKETVTPTKTGPKRIRSASAPSNFVDDEAGVSGDDSGDEDPGDDDDSGDDGGDSVGESDDDLQIIGSESDAHGEEPIETPAQKNRRVKTHMYVLCYFMSVKDKKWPNAKVTVTNEVASEEDLEWMNQVYKSPFAKMKEEEFKITRNSSRVFSTDTYHMPTKELMSYCFWIGFVPSMQRDPISRHAARLLGSRYVDTIATSIAGVKGNVNLKKFHLVTIFGECQEIMHAYGMFHEEFKILYMNKDDENMMFYTTRIKIYEYDNTDAHCNKVSVLVQNRIYDEYRSWADLRTGSGGVTYRTMMPWDILNYSGMSKHDSDYSGKGLAYQIFGNDVMRGGWYNHTFSTVYKYPYYVFADGIMVLEVTEEDKEKMGSNVTFYDWQNAPDGLCVLGPLYMDVDILVFYWKTKKWLSTLGTTLGFMRNSDEGEEQMDTRANEEVFAELPEVGCCICEPDRVVCMGIKMCKRCYKNEDGSRASTETKVCGVAKMTSCGYNGCNPDKCEYCYRRSYVQRYGHTGVLKRMVLDRVGLASAEPDEKAKDVEEKKGADGNHDVNELVKNEVNVDWMYPIMTLLLRQLHRLKRNEFTRIQPGNYTHYATKVDDDEWEAIEYVMVALGHGLGVYAKHSNAIWMEGHPGSGKSTLASFITDMSSSVYSVDIMDDSKFSVSPVCKNRFGEMRLLQVMSIPDLQTKIPNGVAAKLCAFLVPRRGIGIDTVKTEMKNQNAQTIKKPDQQFRLVTCSNLPLSQVVAGDTTGFPRRQMVISMPFRDTDDIKNVDIDGWMCNKEVLGRIVVAAILMAERSSLEHGMKVMEMPMLMKKLRDEFNTSYAEKTGDTDPNVFRDYIMQTYHYKQDHVKTVNEIIAGFKLYAKDLKDYFVESRLILQTQLTSILTNSVSKEIKLNTRVRRCSKCHRVYRIGNCGIGVGLCVISSVRNGYTNVG